MFLKGTKNYKIIFHRFIQIYKLIQIYNHIQLSKKSVIVILNILCHVDNR